MEIYNELDDITRAQFKKVADELESIKRAMNGFSNWLTDLDDRVKKLEQYFNEK